jgi:TolB protein
VSLRLLLLSFLLLSGAVRAELVIEVTQGVDRPVPLAVVPFGLVGETQLPEDVAQIVGDDLARSGQFRVLPRGDMLSRPSREEEVFYRDWQAVGSEYLVFGQVTRTPAGSYEVVFQLHDVPRGRRLLAQRIPSTAAQLRDVAHYISDTVYKHITGVPGIFSTKLLYVTVQRSKVDGKIRSKYGLQYADADGARAVTVMQSAESIMSPTWSPDGRQFAYVSFESGEPVIYVQERATAKRRKLSSFPGINGAPVWSPDGSKLAMTLSRDGNAELYLHDIASGNLERLTNHPGIDTEPSWSPDGKWLVFTSSRSGGPQIYRLDIATKEVRRLTFEGTYNARARVTPDGDALVMVHRDAGQRFRIARLDLARNTLQVLTDTALDESPSISPNGAMAIYATNYKGQGVLSAVSLDGKVRYRLPAREGEVREPAWSPFLR